MSERFDITMNYALGARILLNFRWESRMKNILSANGSVKKLKECFATLPPPEHHKDERNNFLYLMAVGYPHLYRKMSGREIKKCTAMWGIEYLFNTYDEVPDDFTIEYARNYSADEIPVVEEEEEEEEEKPKPKPKPKPVAKPKPAPKRRAKKVEEPAKKVEEHSHVKAIEVGEIKEPLEIVRVKVKKFQHEGKEYFIDTATQDLYASDLSRKVGVYDREKKEIIPEPIDPEIVAPQFAEGWYSASDEELLDEIESKGIEVNPEWSRQDMIRALWEIVEDKECWWA